MMKRSYGLIILLIILLQLSAFTGCSSSSVGSYAGANKMTSQTGISTSKAADAAAAPSKSSSQNIAANVSGSRKIVRSADVSVQTLKYEQSILQLENLVNQYGGYIQNSNTVDSGIASEAKIRNANYVLRIPSAKLDDFLKSTGEIGKIVSKAIQGEDVTQSYYDTESRLTTLKEEQSRILDILSKTSNMADVLTIEDKLTNIQDQIEQLTGELKKWDSLVDLSTVRVQIQEVKEYTTSPTGFGNQIAQVFSSSLKALGAVLRGAVIVLVAILPFVILLALIAAAVLLIRKRILCRHPPDEKIRKKTPDTDKSRKEITNMRQDDSQDNHPE